jgi:exopolyphosphatase/guanosine-5'-triphosphate,3'-diphosphate pyrophosphatase
MAQLESTVEIMDLIKAVAYVYNRDQAHSTRITQFSMSIFDELYQLHNYGYQERRLLEMAALMHDIGYSHSEQKPHNKASRDLILSMKIPGLSETERMVLALVARYHTGELPDADEHRQFGELPAQAQDTVEWLAAILRVADALDTKHLNVVKRVSLEVSTRQVVFMLDVNGDCRKQISRPQKRRPAG